MGRAPCCEEGGLKKGPWTPEEDQKLVEHIQKHGHGSWRKLPKLAGLNRCGKSCRLRWTNYLRPDIKRGKFTDEEERLVIHLHSVLGNKWSAIAVRLPGRTDNEIKNYWNTHLRKKLLHMGIDPVTHRPRADLNLLANLPCLLDSVKFGSNLTNPWDNALRLQADATQLARMQLLQDLIQVLSPNAPRNLEVNNLMGLGFICNYPSNDSLQMNCQPQVVDNTFDIGQGSLYQSHMNLTNLGRTLSPNDFQFLSESCLPLDGKDMGSQSYNGSCSNALAVNPNSGSDNQMCSSYTNPTAYSTPSLVSASSENFSMDQIPELMNLNDVTVDSSTATTFNSWEGLNLDGSGSDFNWKDILDQATLFAGPTFA